MLRLLLIASIAIPAAAVAAKEDAQKRERRICKREVATGSLVKAKRTCLTETEWRRAHEHNRLNVEEWQTVIDSTQRNG